MCGITTNKKTNNFMSTHVSSWESLEEEKEMKKGLIVFYSKTKLFSATSIGLKSQSSKS